MYGGYERNQMKLMLALGWNNVLWETMNKNSP
jgi:hypothetical protein